MFIQHLPQFNEGGLQMSVTSGFYNTQNHDRRYNAKLIGDLFAGILNDGVFANIGTSLVVVASAGMVVNVGIGRAWFNNTWTDNDSILPLVVSVSELILNRIDSVVLEVEASDAVRANTIKIIKGTPGALTAPVMVNTDKVHQYRLADIYVGAGVTAITQANITNFVGTVDCPFVSGVLETITVEGITAILQGRFDEWFANLQIQLSGDVAGNLQNEIDTLCFKYSEVDSIDKIGTIKSTVRTDLGEKWLLCNGDVVDSVAYPDLATQLPYTNNTTVGTYTQNSGEEFYQVASGLGLIILSGRITLNTYSVPNFRVISSGNTPNVHTDVASPSGITSPSLYGCGICFDGTKFVSVVGCSSTTAKVYTSVNGIDWTYAAQVAIKDDTSNKIFYLNNKYIIAYRDSSIINFICSDSPAGPWSTPVSTGINDSMSDLAYGNGVYVLTTINCNVAWTASLTTAWTRLTQDQTYFGHTLVFAKGYFMCGKRYSINGAVWSDIPALASAGVGLACAFDHGFFLVSAPAASRMYYSESVAGPWNYFSLSTFSTSDMFKAAGGYIFGIEYSSQPIHYIAKALRAKFLPKITADTHYTYIKALG
jgi:hypothetical protein